MNDEIEEVKFVEAVFEAGAWYIRFYDQAENKLELLADDVFEAVINATRQEAIERAARRYKAAHLDLEDGFVAADKYQIKTDELMAAEKELTDALAECI